MVIFLVGALLNAFVPTFQLSARASRCRSALVVMYEWWSRCSTVRISTIRRCVKARAVSRQVINAF